MASLNKKLILLADSTIIDKEGKLSILGIFDRIFANQHPAVHPHFDLVMILEGEDGDYKERAILRDPDGVELIKSDYLPFKVNNGKAQIVNQFQNIVLPKKGQYKLEIEVEGQGVVDDFKFNVEPPRN